MARRLASPSKSIVRVLLIVAVAAALCLPFLLVGVPTGSDSTDHVMYQYHFSQQFWSGDHYPRWLAEANKGYGSPIFLVQYPVPYFTTALLRPILSFAPTDSRESRELGIYCFLMLAGAGLSASFWFRYRCAPIASTVAAVAYISLPYIIGQVLYARMAIGELATFVWMPLLFAFCDRVHPGRFGVVSAIAIVFALLVMSNVLTAILFIPVVVLYAVASGQRATLPILLALAFGICIAAVYAFPLAAYQRLFIPGAEIVHHHFAELGRNLLYISVSQVKNHRIAIPAIIGATGLMLFIAYHIARGGGRLVARLGMLLTLGLGTALLIPGLGPALIELSRLRVSGFDSFADFSMNILFTALFTVGLAFLSYCRVSGEESDPRERVLLAVCCCTFVFMLPWSAGIWKIIPKTEVLQFPWRLCSILTLCAAGLFASAINDCLRHGVRGEKKPSLLVMISVAVVVICASNIIWRIDSRFRELNTPHVDVTRWLDPMYSTYVPPLKLAAFAKSVGSSPDTYDVESTPVEQGVRAEFMAGKGSVSVMRAAPGKLLVSAQCQGDARVRIGQLYFPLWRIVHATGSPRDDETLATSAEGLMEVSLGSGQHEFWLVFGGGFPERCGAIVSLVSLWVIVGGFAFVGLRERKRRSNRKALLCAL